MNLLHLSSQATDSVLASTSGATAAVATIAATAPSIQDGVSSYIPAIIAAVAGPLLAMGWRSVLVIFQARRAKKRAILAAEAEAALADNDPLNDKEAKQKLLEVQLLDAEIKAVDKLIDKVD